LKSIVVYKSLSGFTEKYAVWIAEELEADLGDVRDVSLDRLLKCDVIVFGGSLHAVGINGVDFIKNNLSKLSHKKIVVFAVGASPPRADILEEVKNKNFSAEEQKNIRFFYLRGGFDYSKLDFTNKLLMNLLKVRLALKRNKTSDEKEMQAAYSNPVDFTKKEKIKPLVEYVCSLE
jgi:menaquinone-dependent protoporphyrinogen IX oxidase